MTTAPVDRSGHALPVPAGAGPALLGEPVQRVRALLREGRVDFAVGCAVRLLDSAARLDDVERVALLAVAVEGQLALGDLGAARQLMPALLEHLDRTDAAAGPIAAHACALVATAGGEHARALELFERIPRLATTADVEALVSWRPDAAFTLLRLGRRAEASALAHEHQHRVLGLGPVELAASLRVLATTDPLAAVERLRTAHSLLVGAPAARLRAQVETDLAARLLLSPSPDVDPADTHAEAVRLLRSAEHYAGVQGLAPLRERVRSLLERLGEPALRVEAELLTALSPGERRVAGLVLDGLSNRETAERLTVSIKAVEGHLSKIYRKLGVTSRSQLVSAAREHG